MRSITATLTAAARSASASPYLQVRAIRKIGAVGRLDWERIYTGGESERQLAMAQAGDGSIIRIRVSDTNGVQIQRTAVPSGSSDWATWPGSTASGVSRVAICARGATAWAFYSATIGNAIYACSSSDYGATWSGWAMIDAGGTATLQIACSIKASTGDVLVVFHRGATVYTLKRTGAGWGAAAAWTNTANSITGLAVHYVNDWNLIITGTEDTTTHPMVWTAIYGDGDAYGVGTWGPLVELEAASAGALVTYSYPSLALLDVYRTFFLEAYAGTTSYSRPYFSHSLPSAPFVESLWREPVPFNLEPCTLGIALAWATGAYAYAGTNSGVWRAPLVSGSGLDLTSAVTGLVATTGLIPGGATVRLDNSAGTYANPGAGALLELQRGAMLTIDPGYRTTAGAEGSSGGPTYWIESLAYASARGRAELVIEAVDALGLLATWTARRQHTWTAGAKNVQSLISWLFARVGLEATGSGQNSSALVNLYPAFTVHPGERGTTALARLLAMVPDRIIMKSTTAYLHDPRAADASGYSYGTTHQILDGRYATQGLRANHAQVLGLSHFSEAFDWAEISLVSNRTAKVHDINLTTAAQCLARAQAELRLLAISARADASTVRVRPGQEVLDVIDVTDPTAGLSAARRRITGIRMEYLPAKAIYQHTLTLGDV